MKEDTYLKIEPRTAFSVPEACRFFHRIIEDQNICMIWSGDMYSFIAPINQIHLFLDDGDFIYRASVDQTIQNLHVYCDTRPKYPILIMKEDKPVALFHSINYLKDKTSLDLGTVKANIAAILDDV